MRTLIYKRTHSGDPDPTSGTFGVRDCMGKVRDRSFEAVIGCGGTGDEARSWRIAGNLTWVGIGPHREDAPPRFRGRTLVTFDHFLYYGENGRPLAELAPHLAAHLYGRNVRVLMDRLSAEERDEVGHILELARDASPSPGVGARSNRPSNRSRCL